MSFYRWRTLTGPIPFGLQGVLILRGLRIDHTQFDGGAIPVPLFRGARPVYVAVDSALPPGYDIQYDYGTGNLTLYEWKDVDQEWRPADSIPNTFNLRVLFIYEALRAS
jgi:hypothetical protein